MTDVPYQEVTQRPRYNSRGKTYRPKYTGDVFLAVTPQYPGALR